MRSGTKRRWIAAGVCVLALGAGVVWHTKGQDEGRRQASARKGETPTVAIPAHLSRQTPQPFALDAAIARSAVRNGEMRVALPDGTSFPVRIERQYTDETKHWNVVGRVQTQLGPEAMVLTFGGNAVFGVLPTPDGGSLRIATMPGDKVTIAPAGDMVPRGVDPRDSKDVLYPPRRETSIASTPATPKRAASQRERITAPSPATKALVPQRTMSIAKGAIASTVAPAPVRIDVLATYSQELVTYRGSVAAAQTEVANLFAIANQAHVDSGTLVTLRSVGLQQVQVDPITLNEDLLDGIRTAGSKLGATDFEALRDTYAADLVTIVRPYRPEDTTCGIAWLANQGARRNNVIDPQYAYSVVNVGDCSPHILAHETGHSLGSMHDRETETDPDGTLHYGAYVFSFAQRTHNFATIMAYSIDQPRVGYFSNPRSTACGAKCGVEDRMDNVRSIQLMAPTIAAYRSTKDRAALLDVETSEGGDWQNTTVYIPIILSGAAPLNVQPEFQVTVAGGTATINDDYDFDPYVTYTLMGDQRFIAANLRVRGDTAIEANETVILRLKSLNGILISDTDAVVTIVDDDPGAIVQGKLYFPPGMAKPQEVQINYWGTTGRADEGEGWFTAYAPDYTYEIPASYGAPLRFEVGGAPQPNVLFPSQFVQEVSGDIVKPLMFEKTYTLSGQVKAAAGTSLGTNPFNLYFTEYRDGKTRYEQLAVMVSPPDFKYSVPFSAHSSLELNVQPWGTNAKEYLTYLEPMPARDALFRPTLSTLPTLYSFGLIHIAPGDAAYVIFALTEASPTDVTLRYRTVDGTAKAGQAYTAKSGTVTIPAGYGYDIVEITTMPADSPGRSVYFDVAIDQVTGANPSSASVRTWVSDLGLRSGGPAQKQ